MNNRVVRFILVVVGWISVVLGVIGIFLPLLPTTPFLLLASACFMRGSPRLNQWLCQHPQLGPILTTWHQHRAVSATVKRRANVMIILSFLFSIILVPLWWHKIMLFIGAIILLIGFNRVPVVKSVIHSPSVAEKEENQ